MAERSATFIAGWVALAPFLLLSISRTVGLDEGSATLFRAETLLHESTIGIAFALVAVFITRARTLMIGVAISVLLALVLFRHDAPGNRITATASGPLVRVVSVDFDVDNDEIIDMLDAVVALDGDVVLLHGATADQFAGIRGTDVGGLFPFAREWNETTNGYLLSRLAIDRVRLVEARGRSFPSFTLRLAGTAIDVVAVETTSAGQDLDALTDQLDVLRDFARARARDRRSVALVGDFNASTEHGPFLDLIASGLTDAHRARGRSFDRSWPHGVLGVPPFVLRDRVVVTSDVAVRSVDTVSLPFVAHRAVVADLQLP